MEALLRATELERSRLALESRTRELMRVETALRAETHVLALLNDIGLNLTAKVSLRRVMQTVTDGGMDISGARYGAFISNPGQRLADLAGRPLRTTCGEARRFLRVRRDVEEALGSGRLSWDRACRVADLWSESEPAFQAHVHRTRRGAARSLMFVPVASRSGDVMGALVFAHDHCGIFTARTQQILAGVAAQAAVVIENASLYARLQRRLGLLNASLRKQRNYLAGLQNVSRRLMQVEEEEGRRLARELHDRVSANLTALLLQVELMRKEDGAAKDGVLARRLYGFEQTLHTTMGHVRNLLSDLRPTGLDELGLMAALRHQAAVLSERSRVEFVVLGREPSPRMRPDCEMAFFRIAQEAWTNVLKHANASRAVLTLTATRRHVAMQIVDDGTGFNALAEGTVTPALGLTTMRERAQAIGAMLNLDGAPGAGVRLGLSVARAHVEGAA